MVLRSRGLLTHGAEPGTDLGIVSGTINDEVEPIEHSTNVRVEGSEIVRHLDLMLMNQGNNQGEVCYPEDMELYLIADSNEEEEEEEDDGGFWSGVWNGAKTVGHHTVGFGKGLGNGIKDTAVGLGHMAYDMNPVGIGVGIVEDGSRAFGNDWQAPDWAPNSNDVRDGIVAVVKDPSLIVEPVTDAWGRGEYGEAFGYATWMGVETLAGTKGVSRAVSGISKGTKAARTVVTKTDDVAEAGAQAATKTDDVANAASKADEVAEASPQKTGRVSAPKIDIPTIGGRRPINYQWAGKTHPSGIKFDYQGFPIFEPYSKATFRTRNLTGDYRKDAAMANKYYNFNKTPEGYVWHHHQDATTMILIPQHIHNSVRHTGGAAVIRNGGFDK